MQPRPSISIPSNSLRVLLAAFAISCSIIAPARPSTIDSIEIERLPVFPDTAAGSLPWYMRLANRIHVRTREWVIRREILVQEGSPLDTLRLRESERLLRQRGLFERVQITHEESDAGAGRRNVRIRAQDLWTLSVLLSFEKQDQLKTFLIGVEESNLLGTGNEIRWIQVFSTDRDGLVAGLEIPRVAGTRAVATLSYVDLEDNRSRSAAIGHDPETVFDHWTYGADGFLSRAEQRFYRRGEETGATPFREEGYAGHVGRFTGRVLQAGWGVGWVERRRHPRGEPKSEEPGAPLPPAMEVRRHRGPILYGGLMRRRFLETANLERYGTVEDVPLGWVAQIALGPNLERDGQKGRSFHARAYLAGGMLPLRKVGIGAEITASAFARSRGGLGEWATRALGGAAWQPNRRTLSVVQIATLVGGHRPATSVVYMGTDTGLRGFPAREFEARDYLLATFEQRFWTGRELLWTGIGANLFVDAGLPSRAGFRSEDRWRTGWGLGLLLGIRKSLQRPIRVEIAWRTDRKAGPTFTVSTATSLRIVPSIFLPSPTREFAAPTR